VTCDCKILKIEGSTFPWPPVKIIDCLANNDHIVKW